MSIKLPSRYVLDTARPVLGEGGMGRVLLARDVYLDVPVALKVVRPDFAADPRFRKLFDLEVRIAARFMHPHIVPLHDLGSLGDGTPFLGLAYADAGSFASLRDTVLPWSELLRLTLELLDALGHLHAREVLHRDLKPENILLFTGADGLLHVWLADLGLANASSQLARRKGRVEGTPGFMAPEQKLGLPREYGPWTDLYSLGVILWELVTGNLPFGSKGSPLDTELPPLIPRDGVCIPDGLDVVLANLLAGEPLSRYDLAADLRTELEALGDPAIDTEAIRTGQFRIGPPRLGTVAPCAPMVKSQGSSRSTGQGGEGGQVVFQVGVPIWNRPRPKPLPDVPVPETGLGASARASLPLFAMRELPLVARDDYRGVLWQIAREVAADGRGRVALVIGEAGSGKTRLMESVARTIEEGGWGEPIYMSWQRPPGAEDGYAGAARALIRPWNETRDSLESRLRRRLARERGAVDQGVAEESGMLARWSGMLKPDEEPVAAGYGLREVYRWLESRAWRGLSCLILDHAQYAVEEGDGLAIVESVLQKAAEGRAKRLFVMVGLRSEDLAQDAELAERVDELVAMGARRVDLPRLDRLGTEALLNEMLTLAPKIASRVAERCEGNPLFARQLLQEWASRGWLVDTGGLQFGLAPGVDADAVLPADSEALFRSRVEALAETSDDPVAFVDAVHTAALAGQVIPREPFEAIAGPELLPFMRGCGLWHATEDLYRFDHGLLHQAVRAQAMSRDDVAVLHADLARIWAEYGERSGIQVAFEVGQHAHAAGQFSLAIDHLLRAAEHASHRNRTQELEHAARLARDAVERAPELIGKVGWAHLWQARAWQARGAAQEANGEFAEARVAFERTADVAGLVEALVGMAWAARQSGDIAESEKLYKDAMRRAKEARDVRAEASAIAGLAWVEQQKRNFEGADILFTRVLNRFTQISDRRGAAEATIGQAFVARRKGAFAEAEELYEEAATAFQEADDLLGVARALHGRAVVQRQRLQLEEADRLFRRALATADELGATDLVMEARVGLAEIARLRGDFEKARQIYELHARWAERGRLLEPAIFARLGLAHVALLEGDLQAMYEQSVAASKHLGKVPGHWLWAIYRLSVATLLALRKDEQQTYRWLWSAAELGLTDTVDHDIAYLLTTICHVAQKQRWANVMKVAGKLAVSQWERLGAAEQAREVAAMSQALTSG